MSEYQYYEWQTIDRLLTEAEQDAVNSLSSHIEVSASRAVVTYNWGDFKHDPRKVLARYFDAFLYFANWGTRTVMFRFPLGLLDEEALAPYLVEDLIELSTEGKAHILEISFEEEPEWDNFEGELAGLVGLRNDLLEGDFRCLYLAWLKALTLLETEAQADFEEPPVPAGLGKLTPVLQRFAQFFDLDSHLIKSAAAASPARSADTSETALQQAIGKLSREECDAFLLRLLQGEAGLGFTLKHRLQAELKAPRQLAGKAGRTLDELLEGAEQLKREEARRKAAEAETRRIAALEKLGQQEEKAWETVDTLLAERNWSHHAQAVEQLQQLRDLADYQKTRAEFDRRLKELREQHKARPALMKRFKEAGLLG